MNDWTAGYVADVSYSSQYYPELNHVRLPIALLNAGYTPPTIRNACELGFGQGVSLNVHAAAQGDVKWYGNDFNPSHVAFADRLAKDAALDVKLFEDSFERFFARTDLPDFDFIALHGIWSWVSEENRNRIIDFIDRKLTVGGIVYASYNMLPGWSSAMPLRQLLSYFAKTMAPAGLDSLSKAKLALEYAENFVASDPAYAVANPQVKERIAQLKTMDVRYIAHEYLNQDWAPMYFPQVADFMSRAKLTFACSANYSDMIDEIWMPQPQQQILADTTSAVSHQAARDFLVNQQFRKDVWIKGDEGLAPRQRLNMLVKQRVVLTVAPSEITMTAKLGGVELNLQEAVYRPIIEVLSNHKPHQVAELQAALSGKGVDGMQALQAVVILIGAGYVSPVQDAAGVTASRKSAARLNAAIMERALYGADVAVLASPLTGGAQVVDRISILFSQAADRGLSKASDLAGHVWAVLQADGQVVLADGVALSSAEDNLAELTRRAEVFLGQLPMWRTLGYATDIPSSKNRRN